MKINVTEHPVQVGDPDEPTIEVRGFFGKPKRVTRDQYVKLWVDHAKQLMNIGISITAETERKANEAFDEGLKRNV